MMTHKFQNRYWHTRIDDQGFVQVPAELLSELGLTMDTRIVWVLTDNNDVVLKQCGSSLPTEYDQNVDEQPINRTGGQWAGLGNVPDDFAFTDEEIEQLFHGVAPKENDAGAT